MYAITSDSFRAIETTDDLRSGETAIDVIPDALLLATKAASARAHRDVLLLACDWTQVADVPLDDATKAAWCTYRQALRNVPQQSGFPATVEWPEPPG